MSAPDEASPTLVQNSTEPNTPHGSCDDASSQAPVAPDHRARAFVWLVWLVMGIAALAYVSRYGSNVPSWDEWDMVPALTGNQPVTWDWLWSQHNEHRVPVPRLLLLALNRPFGVDFRIAMYFNVLVTALLAAAAIVVARKVRGRTSWSDAFVPVVLLNLGQGLNFIWGWQIEFFASTVLAGAALLLIVLYGRRPNARLALLLGVILALLVGTGAHGVALAPALASWLAVAAVLRWRDSSRQDTEARSTARRDATVLAAVAVGGLAMAAIYFVGFEKVPYHPSSPSRRASVVTSAQFLTMGFGPAVRPIWPISGLLLAGLLSVAGVIGLAALRRSDERSRALGLLAFLGAMGCLALGIGLGRDGFEPRYITLSIPALLAVYFILTLYAPGRSRGAGQWAMLIAACAALWPNMRFGLEYGRILRENLAAFERDVANGKPPYKLAYEYGRWLHPHPDVVGDYLPMLRDARIEPYAHLANDPAFSAIAVPLVPAETSELEWDAATLTADVTGYRSHLIFKLDAPARIAGIRLRYTHTKPSGGIPYVSIHWKNGDSDEFDTERFTKYSATGDHANWKRGTYARLDDSESTMTVWVLGEIDAIRIHPDFEPCTFNIHELTLLVEE